MESANIRQLLHFLTSLIWNYLPWLTKVIVIMNDTAILS